MHAGRARRKTRWGRYVLAAYLVLLAVSHVVRLFAPANSPHPGQQTVSLPAFDGDRALDERVVVAYDDLHPAAGGERPVLVLLHGSPAASRSMTRLARTLADSFRVVVPDLPGFGGSTLRVPDYSIRAHGHYLVALLDALGIRQAHLVAYSMGGGVALHAYDEAPARIASVTMLSAIGVQELELLGDYSLNRAIHGLQLAFFWLLEEGVPHMGYLDDAMLGVRYARNFFDTDQRPLRGLLERFRPPMLILHGKKDPLVLFAVAEEHARIVPQSEYVWYEGGHGMVFSQGQALAVSITRFVRHVEEGRAPTRAEAAPARVAAAQASFNPARIPRAEGFTLIVLVVLLALSTLVSEDLACIGAGLLVARGTLDFLPAMLACFFGIFFGDLLLFLAGRVVGRPVVRLAPLKWLIDRDDLERGRAWLARRGPAVILASRFVPGSRLPTYVAAGVLQTSFWRFTLYFFLACAVWTPLLVGLSALFGSQIQPLLTGYQDYALLALAGVLLVLWVALRLAVPLLSERGRRLLLSKWRRLTRWEFWPLWAFYPPIVLYIGYLALRHRSLTLFTAANPAIEAGGFVGESKAAILKGLEGAGGALARYAVVEPDDDVAQRAARVAAFMDRNGLGFPIVLKPDVGERGEKVGILRSEAEVAAYLRRHPDRTIAQEYVPGREFGVFYYRYPDEARGHIFSITDKRFPIVVGDGESALESLILRDERAVCMARFYLEKHRDRLHDVPAAGQQIQLVELGTHCRGAVFLDGTPLKTPALEAAIDAVSRGFEGFYFGRYDLRTPSVEALGQGHFKIVELNGVTSEATHIYDPKHTLGQAYRTLGRQWRIAFDIAAQNVRRGARPARLRALARLFLLHKA